MPDRDDCLDVAYARPGRLDEVVREWETVLRLNQLFPGVRVGLENIREQQRERAAAPRR